MFHMLLHTLVCSNPVMAMIPPDGWISLGDGHALNEENTPAKGELLELKVDSDVVSLGFGLMDSGFNVLSSTQQENGDVQMLLEDGRIGVARYMTERWVALFYGKETKLKPDSIFNKIRFNDETTPWGIEQEPEVKSWSPNVLEEWGVDERLVGDWICTTMIKGRPVKLSISLDSDGAVRWEETRAGKITTMKGEWLASSDKIGIQLEERTMFVDYDFFQGGLQIRYDNSNFSLLRR